MNDRDSFSRTRYWVFAILSCEHSVEGSYNLPLIAGYSVWCDTCQKEQKVEIAEASIGTLGTGD